jgi:hypothetical protein
MNNLFLHGTIASTNPCPERPLPRCLLLVVYLVKYLGRRQLVWGILGTSILISLMHDKPDPRPDTNVIDKTIHSQQRAVYQAALELVWINKRW